MNSNHHEVEGVVVAVAEGHAVVRAAAAGCPRCAAGKGCGAGVFADATRPREIRIPVSSGGGVRVGETVRLGLSRESLSRAAWFAYGLPLTGLLAASAFAAAMGAGDGQGVIAAAVGMACGMALGRFLSRRAACVRRMRVTLREDAGAVG